MTGMTSWQSPVHVAANLDLFYIAVRQTDREEHIEEEYGGAGVGERRIS